MIPLRPSGIVRVSLANLHPCRGAFMRMVHKELVETAASFQFGRYLEMSPHDGRCRPPGFVPLNALRRRGVKGWYSRAWRPRREVRRWPQ